MLNSLHCDGTGVREIPPSILWSDKLRTLSAQGAPLEGVPPEILAEYDCLEGLRAHFRDLGDSAQPLPDVKLLVLGNGRIGKTQICNRLRGLDFEKEAVSTHGIVVATHDFAPDTMLRMWDFGGQDLYHGAHALFLRTRSVFLVAWTLGAENTATHEYSGVTFRNRPLGWWLDFVRHAAGAESPVLVVQNQCDRPEDDAIRPPVRDETLGAFSFRRVLPYSAKNRRNQAALEEALQGAVSWLRGKQGEVLIGRGRLAVKREIEALQNADAGIAEPGQRRNRTMTTAAFEEMCARQNGAVSRPDLLLDYLHACGVVFFRRGLFQDQIILDQAWALEAIYTVFDRQRGWPHLRAQGGRFRGSLLEALVWGNYSEREQDLFLGMMRSCGICFELRPADYEKGVEAEYLAPDLLPPADEVAPRVRAQWDESAPGEERVLEFPFLHDGLMRGFLGRVGREAGDAAVYWKDGVCFYEDRTGSWAQVEQRHSDQPERWSGSLRLRTQRGRAAELLEICERWVHEAAERIGIACVDGPRRAGRAAAKTEAMGEPPPPEVSIVHPPRAKRTYAVSYGWRERDAQGRPWDARVEALCARAQELGIEVVRDLMRLENGMPISDFMSSLGRHDRVAVILSDKYLHSESCMFELSEIWRYCQREPEQLRAKVRAFVLPDAPIHTLRYKVAVTNHWLREFKEIGPAVAEALLGGGASASMLRQFNQLQAFAQVTSEVIGYIADTLRPGTLEDYVAWTFEEEGR